LASLDGTGTNTYCVWSIEDEQCVARSDPNNIDILRNALVYTADFVKQYYAANPVHYIDLKDPTSVTTANSIAATASGSNCLLNKAWWNCLLSADAMSAGNRCVWSIEDGVCVSRADTKNQKIVDRAKYYPESFVRAHYDAIDPASAKENPLPPANKPVDLTNTKAVKHMDKPLPIVPSRVSDTCQSMRTRARSQNHFYWSECLASLDGTGTNTYCVWSIQDGQCVTRSDNKNMAILSRALQYTAEYVKAFYAANPVHYIDLTDPTSVTTANGIAPQSSAVGATCMLNKQWWACQLAKDGQPANNNCIWSIEDGVCVSPVDTVNAKIVERAKYYTPAFVKAHYDAIGQK